MRLGQLARKLGMRPTEIVEFLGENQIQIDDGSNTRLENEHVTMIMRHFDPPSADEAGDEVSEKLETKIMEDSPTTVSQENDTVSEPVRRLEEEDADAKDIADIIKVPKIELSGLKVLGRIDLPESRKIVSPPESLDEPATEEVAKRPEQMERKNIEQKKQRYNQRPRKNPIAMKREREAEDLQRKRETQAKEEKERRTRNYLKKVNLSPPTKAMRLVSEPLMQMSAEELAEDPKTWLGKLVKWLTKA